MNPVRIKFVLNADYVWAQSDYVVSDEAYVHELLCKAIHEEDLDALGKLNRFVEDIQVSTNNE